MHHDNNLHVYHLPSTARLSRPAHQGEIEKKLRTGLCGLQYYISNGADFNNYFQGFVPFSVLTCTTFCRLCAALKNFCGHYIVYQDFVSVLVSFGIPKITYTIATCRRSHRQLSNRKFRPNCNCGTPLLEAKLSHFSGYSASIWLLLFVLWHSPPPFPFTLTHQRFADTSVNCMWTTNLTAKYETSFRLTTRCHL